MSDTPPRRHHTLLLVLGIILASWGFLLFFQSAYFGAFFYGVPVPFWANWVGGIPIWSFDAIDTVMVAVLVVAVVVSSHWYNAKERRGRSSRGSAGWIVTAVGLFLLVAFLAIAGFNLLGLWAAFKSFFAGLSWGI